MPNGRYMAIAVFVGLGAFVLESYTPGNGNSFKLVRNEEEAMKGVAQ